MRVEMLLESYQHPHQKVIDIHLHPSPSLLPITSLSTPSSSVLPIRYSTYSTMPSSLLPFYSRPLYVIVTTRLVVVRLGTESSEIERGNI
jgi:hypothetical protein